ncbi:hypothetical protein D9M72_529620 [compost metagenome]
MLDTGRPGLGVLEPDFPRRKLHVGDPAGVEQPGGEHVLYHVAADRRVLVAAVPDHPYLIAVGFHAAHTHVAHQFLVGGDAVHGFAQGGAVHGDVAQNAPGSGLHVARRMQAEQDVAGFPDQVGQQALVGFAGQALAVVRQVVRADTGRGQGGGLIHAKLFCMAQVLEKCGNRGIAERLHVVLVMS